MAVLLLSMLDNGTNLFPGGGTHPRLGNRIILEPWAIVQLNQRLWAIVQLNPNETMEQIRCN